MREYHKQSATKRNPKESWLGKWKVIPDGIIVTQEKMRALERVNV